MDTFEVDGMQFGRGVEVLYRLRPSARVMRGRILGSLAGNVLVSEDELFGEPCVPEHFAVVGSGFGRDLLDEYERQRSPLPSVEAPAPRRGRYESFESRIGRRAATSARRRIS